VSGISGSAGKFRAYFCSANEIKKQYTLLFANATDSRHLCIVGKVVALFFPFSLTNGPSVITQ